MLDEALGDRDATGVPVAETPEEGEAEADDDGVAFSITVAGEDTGTSTAALLLLLGAGLVAEAEAARINVASTPYFFAQSAALSFSGQQYVWPAPSEVQ